MARKSARRKGRGLGDRDPEQLRKFWKPPRGAKLGASSQSHRLSIRTRASAVSSASRAAIKYAEGGRCSTAIQFLTDAAIAAGAADAHLVAIVKRKKGNNDYDAAASAMQVMLDAQRVVITKCARNSGARYK